VIEVNLKQLREAINSYNNVIKTLEDNNTAIINNFNELGKHWQDERINKLSASFNLESQRALKLEKNVKSQLAVYREVAKGYEAIGRQVKCNLSGQDIINAKIDNIINKINNIIARYDSLGDISFYPRAYLIRSNKRKMKLILKEFKTIKSELNKKFNDIREIENSVQKKIAAIKVEYITVNNYEREE